MAPAARPRILAPSTPATFLSHILTHHRHPTTVLICAARADFLHAAVSELHDSPPPPLPLPDDPGLDRPITTENADKRDVLRATLAHIATARHIQTAFVPSVSHLRAYLSVFPASSGTSVPAPPESQQNQKKEGGVLLVYGFLDVHRDGGEWSAQGIGCSAACLVEAAARSGLAAVLMEPTGWQDGEEGGVEGKTMGTPYEEQIPVLSTTASVREDGTWGVPCTSARTILQRWFTFYDS